MFSEQTKIPKSKLEPSTKKLKRGEEEEEEDYEPPKAQKLDSFFKAAKTNFKSNRIKTVVVTHGDTDHYGWLKEFLQQTKVEHLILGGLPNHYKASFLGWVEELLKDETKIYVPALADKAITSVEAFQDLQKQKTVLAHTYHHHPKHGDSKLAFLEDALKLADGMKISLLSVNPTHYWDEEGAPVRTSLSADTNSDSLVMKLSHQAGSMILTGDATELTTNRILQNYRHQPDFLQTDVLLASHHGSSFQKTNDSLWIQATTPKLVLISNGLLYGHPSTEAYETFKKSSRLLVVGKKPHTVFSGAASTKGEGEERVSQLMQHRTNRGIYSTLTNGDLTVTFLDERDIKLESACLKKPIQLSKLEPGTPLIDEEAPNTLNIEETEDSFILTPAHQASAPSQHPPASPKALFWEEENETKKTVERESESDREGSH
ncbi:MAG: ComEC/Rec2 family competence protein [Alphaproteobacteria bacterium]